MSFIEKIFSIYRENNHKVIKILGIKFRFNYYNNFATKEDISELKQQLNLTKCYITRI